MLNKMLTHSEMLLKELINFDIGIEPTYNPAPLQHSCVSNIFNIHLYEIILYVNHLNVGNMKPTKKM